MKITVKTLQQKQFQIDAEGTDTVADLKVKIFESQGHQIESQKIIYSGKVLADDKTVESCQIKEKDFLVVMVSKPKPSPVVAPSSSSAAKEPAAAPAAAAAQPPAPAPAAVNPAPDAMDVTPTPTTPAAAPAAAAPAFGDMSSFLSGDALSTSIQNMVEMGFPRAEVDRAMRASFNNPDRAVEYLMNGIPPNLLRPEAPPAQATGAAGGGGTAPATAGAGAAPTAPAQPAAAPAATPAAPQNLFQMAQQQQQGRGGTGGAAHAAGGGDADMDRLRGAESLQGIRQMVQQNPALLQGLIQQFASQDPALAQAVTQNPDLLLQMLAEGAVGEDDPEGEAAPGPNTQIINVTEEERAAIERLQSLGFSREQAIEAYFACGKDEQMAANFLFDGGFED